MRLTLCCRCRDQVSVLSGQGEFGYGQYKTLYNNKHLLIKKHFLFESEFLSFLHTYPTPLLLTSINIHIQYNGITLTRPEVKAPKNACWVLRYFKGKLFFAVCINNVYQVCIRATISGWTVTLLD